MVDTEIPKPRATSQNHQKSRRYLEAKERQFHTESVEDLSDVEPTQTDPDVLAKALTLAITPQLKPTVDLITAIESAVCEKQLEKNWEEEQIGSDGRQRLWFRTSPSRKVSL